MQYLCHTVMYVHQCKTSREQCMLLLQTAYQEELVMQNYKAISAAQRAHFHTVMTVVSSTV
jgi:hypothetical protein